MRFYVRKNKCPKGEGHVTTRRGPGVSDEEKETCLKARPAAGRLSFRDPALLLFLGADDIVILLKAETDSTAIFFRCIPSTTHHFSEDTSADPAGNACKTEEASRRP